MAVLGTALGIAACGGNPFGSGDETPPPPEASAGDAGSESGEAGAGVGASSSGGSNGGAGDENGGSTPPTSGGSSSGAGVGGAGSDSGGNDSGEGGEPPVVVEPVFTMSKLVDDMEDGNATLLSSNGDWFVFKDKTAGTIVPPKEMPFTMSALVPARGASTKGAAVTVSGFTGWGAAFGFDFSYAMGVRRPNDLGPALAVRFWAKASKATTVRLQLPNADTDAVGGKCTTTGEEACGAHWTKAFKVETAWKETTVQFAELAQDLPGRHVPTFDKQHVYSLFFIIGPNQSVTVEVDDVALVH
ncbi:MAG: hypothetical protein EOO73_30555 [Myxococcales bacterium]|nr:MAG: hypothetical protein EOO73_30555 [Myxococcales bacterium]